MRLKKEIDFCTSSLRMAMRFQRAPTSHAPRGRPTSVVDSIRGLERRRK